MDDLDCARQLFRRACGEFYQSVRRGERNDAWFALANAIYVLWPEVDPEGFSEAKIRPQEK